MDKQICHVAQAHPLVFGRGATELSNVPMHLADTGTEENLYDLNATLLENETFLAAEATDALQRIEDGTFGTCEECGEKIATARLEAIPYVRFCLKCAEVAEAGTGPNQKKREIQ